MAPAPLSHYDFLLGHPIKHEKVISARPLLPLFPLPLHSIYIHTHRVPRPVLLRPPVCGTCGAGREGGHVGVARAVRVYVVTYGGSAVPHLVFIMPAGGQGKKGAEEGQGRRFAQLFPLHSPSLPSQHNRQEMEKKEGTREAERGPPILPRLFLPLSRSSGERACGQPRSRSQRCRSSCLPLARARYILNAAKWMR